MTDLDVRRSVMGINWNNASTGWPGDQIGDTTLVTGSYWAVEPWDGQWTVELVEQNATFQLGSFDTEAVAKAACERYETRQVELP